MAITRAQFVQTASAAAGSTSPSATLGAAPTNGNALVCSFRWNQHLGDATLTPPVGWTELTPEVNQTGHVRQRSFYKLAGASESATVSGTLSASRCWVVSIIEYSSTTGWPADPLDKKDDDTADSVTPNAGPTATTTQAEEVWVGFLANKNVDAQTAPTNGFTQVASTVTANGTAAQNVAAGLYEKIVAATGTAQVSATLANARPWTGHIAALKNSPASSAGYFNGVIDEVAVYPYALTPDMVTTHYQAGASQQFGTTLLGDSTRYPSVKVEIAFASKATDAYPLWQDVTAYVRLLETSRGREELLQRFETGLQRLVLKNNDRRFDPSYAAGPYYPNVKFGRQVRTRAFFGGWNGTFDGVFRGTTEEWQQVWQHKGKTAEITVDCVDLFGSLNVIDFAEDFEAPAERSDLRVARVLDLVNVPASLRNLQVGYAIVPAVERATTTGSTNVEPSPLKGTKLLAHLHDVQDAEGGQLFVDRDGVVTFENRHHRNLNERTSRGIFGDDPAELRYADVAIFHGDRIFNDGRVTPGSGNEQRHIAQSSIDEYRARVWSKSLPLSDDNEAEALAQYVVEVHKDPTFRCPEMELLGASDPADLWPHVLGREISHHITVNRRPFGGTLLTFEQAVEGVAHAVTAGTWSTQLTMSRIDLTDYWQLGEAGSELGGNTILGY